ncbi:hypothetical protein NDU88_000695 [Pleurodeles waltl]|uniref:Uncharacterized protein n=1 Tax=Pleurodeles waltl TaxID=8319 RepID=A0AAV7S7Y8_PLEWA|nr:hypothetical protein NDU88_000695 [Pleurodeles waltl]
MVASTEGCSLPEVTGRQVAYLFGRCWRAHGAVLHSSLPTLLPACVRSDSSMVWRVLLRVLWGPATGRGRCFDRLVFKGRHNDLPDALELRDLLVELHNSLKNIDSKIDTPTSRLNNMSNQLAKHDECLAQPELHVSESEDGAVTHAEQL